MASFTTGTGLCNVEAPNFYEAGNVVFNATRAMHFGDKASSVLDSGDVSFFLGKLFWWFPQQMTGSTGFLLIIRYPEVLIVLLSKIKI